MTKEASPWMPLSSRCPSFLNASIRNLNNGRGYSYGSKKKEKSKNVDSRLKISGMTDEGECLIKNLRVVTPECLYQGSTVLKNMDA